MRCKPGDIARLVFLPHLPEVEGRLVEVLAPPVCFIPEPYRPAWNCRVLGSMPAQAIFINGFSMRVQLKAGETVDVPDAWLRPIRPGEGTDETQQWAGLPRQETVPA
jgi:hypothetical protein